MEKSEKDGKKTGHKCSIIKKTKKEWFYMKQLRKKIALAVTGALLASTVFSTFDAGGNMSTISAQETAAEAVGSEAVYEHNLSVYTNQNSQQWLLDLLVAEPDGETSYFINDEIKAVCKEITQDCKNDMEKLQAIHDWVCTNLYYEYNEGMGVTPIYVFYHRGTRCEGFADMTAAMCREVGIPCKEMEGYAISNMNIEGKTISEIEKLCKDSGNEIAHAWNEAWIDGRWVLLDTTWDCRNKNSSSDPTVDYNPCVQTYFDIDLREFSNTHYFAPYISVLEGKYFDAKPTSTPLSTVQPAATATPAPAPTEKPVQGIRPISGINTSSNTVVMPPSQVTNVKAVNKKKKKIQVSWKRIEASGYQIQYAENRSFTKKVKAKWGSNWTKNITISRLKKKKTYYIRVRAYKTKLGQAYWGNWSTVKKVKIKK